MAISFVSDNNNTGVDVRTLSLALGTLAVGDCIAMSVQTEEFGFPEAATPGGATGITWTAKQTQTTSAHCYVKLWQGVVTSAGSKTVTIAPPGSSTLHGAVAGVFPTADGYSFAGTPALVGGASTPVNGAASTTPTATITTVGGAGSIVFWSLGDWNARDGAARTYQSGATDRGYARNVSKATFYWATQVTSGSGSQTVGLTNTLPGGTALPSFVGMEILKSGGSPAFEGWGMSV